MLGASHEAGTIDPSLTLGMTSVHSRFAFLGRAFALRGPLGATLIGEKVAEVFEADKTSFGAIGHGYTYSGNPIASAAGLATLETYKEEGLFERAKEIAPSWEEGLHSLKDVPNVIDIRNIGLIGAIELDPIAGEPTKRAFSAFLKAYESGLLIRTTGDIIALSPPLIISKTQIDELFGKLRTVLNNNI